MKLENSPKNYHEDIYKVFKASHISDHMKSEQKSLLVLPERCRNALNLEYMPSITLNFFQNCFSFTCFNYRIQQIIRVTREPEQSNSTSVSLRL